MIFKIFGKIKKNIYEAGKDREVFSIHFITIFFPYNIYVNSERTSQLKPWTTRELQDIEGFSSQNISCL